jgi:hypothetical protein
LHMPYYLSQTYLTTNLQRYNLVLFYVLLTVQHLSKISVITNLMHKLLFYNKFIIRLYMFRAPCAHYQEVKIVLYSIWYRHTDTSEWSKITKIQFYKYKHIVIKILCEFFGCDYCILLTINML